MAVAALMCLSLIPVSATMTQEPRPPRSISIIIPTLFRRAPSAVVGAFAVGLMNSSVIAIAPVYGVRVGLDPAAAALLFLALQTGSLLFQWPLGWLSDKTDRRRVIAGLSLATAIACLAVIAASLRVDALLLSLAFGLWGGHGALHLCGVHRPCQRSRGDGGDRADHLQPAGLLGAGRHDRTGSGHHADGLDRAPGPVRLLPRRGVDAGRFS